MPLVFTRKLLHQFPAYSFHSLRTAYLNSKSVRLAGRCALNRPQNSPGRFPPKIHPLINPYRIPPDNPCMLPPCLVCLLIPCRLFHGCKDSLQPFQCFLFVHVLASFFRGGSCDSCGDVDDPHPCLHLVHILPAFPAAVELFNPVIRF